MITVQHISVAVCCSWGGADACWLLVFFFFYYIISNHYYLQHLPPNTHTNTLSSSKRLWSGNPLPVWSCSSAACRGVICWQAVLDSDLYQWDWMDEWSPVGPVLSFDSQRWEIVRRGREFQGRKKKEWEQPKEVPSLTMGSLLPLFTQHIDALCSFGTMFKPLHSSARLYLLHYLLPIIPVYRTNKAICPVSKCLAGGFWRTTPSHHLDSLDIPHQSSRLHHICKPVQKVNTTELSKLPHLGWLVWLYTSAPPSVTSPSSLHPPAMEQRKRWQTNI